MGKTTVSIEADDSLPPEVLVEHIRWAMESLTKETGGATVSLYDENPRSHPFDGGVEMFDDKPGYARGGYVGGTSREGGFIPINGGDIAKRAAQAIRDGRNARYS